MSWTPAPESFAMRVEIDNALSRQTAYDAWPAALKAAFDQASASKTAQALRLQLMITLLVSALSLIWDLWAVPELAREAIAWRLIVIWPVAAFGLLVARKHQLRSMKIALAAALTAFGMLSIHLGSYGGDEAMVRYAMATAYILGVSCLSLPFNPRELKLHALVFILATSIAGIWPHPLPPLQLMLHISFMVMSGLPVLAIAQHHWKTNSRAFLLDMRDEFTRAELEQNNELLRQLSEQDPLTGMPNRRHFERVISEGLAGPKRKPNGKIALMMIDLDHFKAFNDRHGHQAGDRCLTMAAVQLQEAFGSRYGIVARYGGEEFVAALQERVEGEAASLAEHMRLTIAKMLVPVRDNSQPLITTSIGLALAPANTTLELEDLIEMADVALYSAKRAGRNRIETIEAGDIADMREGSEDERRRA